MAKWIKNVSGSTQSILGTSTADDAFYQIVASKLAAASENSDIISKVASGDYQMSDDGSSVIDDAANGLNFLYGVSSPKDADGAPMSRVKMFKTGVAVRFHFFSFKTADNSTVYHKDDSGNNYGWCSYKMYDGAGDEITDNANKANAVKTIVDFEPTSIDFEIASGAFYQDSVPTTNIYVWTIGVPDVPAAYGGSIPFCSSANLKILDSKKAFDIDGRVPKTMKYDATNHTNKLRFVFKHDAGVSHECMVQLELAY